MASSILVLAVYLPRFVQSVAHAVRPRVLSRSARVAWLVYELVVLGIVLAADPVGPGKWVVERLTRSVAAGYAGFMGFLLLATPVLRWQAADAPTSDAERRSPDWLGITNLLVVPFSEEILLRGVLLFSVSDGVGVGAAIGASVAADLLLHAYQGPRRAWYHLFAALISIALTFYFGLIAAIVFHFSNNFAVLAVRWANARREASMP